MKKFDFVVRGGTVVDATSGDMFDGDVTVPRGRTAAIGKVLRAAYEDIDADGLFVPRHIDHAAVVTNEKAPGRISIAILRTGDLGGRRRARDLGRRYRPGARPGRRVRGAQRRPD